MTEVLQQSDFLLQFWGIFRKGVLLSDFINILLVDIFKVFSFRIQNYLSGIVKDNTRRTVRKQIAQTILRAVVNILNDPEIILTAINLLHLISSLLITLRIVDTLRLLLESVCLVHCHQVLHTLIFITLLQTSFTSVWLELTRLLLILLSLLELLLPSCRSLISFIEITILNELVIEISVVLKIGCAHELSGRVSTSIRNSVFLFIRIIVIVRVGIHTLKHIGGSLTLLHFLSRAENFSVDLHGLLVGLQITGRRSVLLDVTSIRSSSQSRNRK